MIRAHGSSPTNWNESEVSLEEFKGIFAVDLFSCFAIEQRSHIVLRHRMHTAASHQAHTGATPREGSNHDLALQIASRDIESIFDSYGVGHGIRSNGNRASAGVERN